MTKRVLFWHIMHACKSPPWHEQIKLGYYPSMNSSLIIHALVVLSPFLQLHPLTLSPCPRRPSPNIWLSHLFLSLLLLKSNKKVMEGIAALLESSDTNSNCSQTAEPLHGHALAYFIVAITKPCATNPPQCTCKCRLHFSRPNLVVLFFFEVCRSPGSG